MGGQASCFLETLPEREGGEHGEQTWELDPMVAGRGLAETWAWLSCLGTDCYSADTTPDKNQAETHLRGRETHLRRRGGRGSHVASEDTVIGNWMSPTCTGVARTFQKGSDQAMCPNGPAVPPPPQEA